MSENIILALISKLTTNMVLVLVVLYIIIWQAKKAWNCFYKLHEDQIAKELLKEQRFYKILNDYNLALANNTKAFQEFKEILQKIQIKRKKEK